MYLWECTQPSNRPLAMLLKSAVWKNLSDFQLCDGGGEGRLNRPSVPMIKKLTAKTMDEDPTGCQRWISIRIEI